ncbi:hypothetical protein [Gemmatimonas phototrophica]|uniref:hypothetical protein n=1 Tax=Gemmatimonas phototrophica TaxID=1379270 RepID=UPI001314F0CE|nr:hypothetical protein [Gemmatimonas phototrophica]
MTASGHVRPARRFRRPSTLALAVVLAALAVPQRDALAQRERRVGSVPREVALEVTHLFNASTTRRVRGDFTLAATDTVRGDLAILNGNARLSGVVYGDVVVLNGDAFLADGARLGKGLTVLGGTFESPERPNVAGEIRVWSSRYRYQESGDTLVADTDFLTRFSEWVRDEDEGSTQSQLFVTTAHTYNRVEGLPIFIGPRFRTRHGDTRVRAEVFGIFRTGDQLVWKDENLGHRVLFEVRQGNTRGIAVGGRLFDEVDAMERWQLTDAEVGLATFLFSRDYRDYWERHGAQGYVSIFAGRGHELRASVGEERWNARRSRDVFRLNDEVALRPNPQGDEGVMRLLTLSGTFDTRTNPKNPLSGWYLRGEYERGTSTDFLPGNALTAGARPLAATASSVADTRLAYGRALLDLRRYNRLGPNAQLNLRAVFGGWMNGDPLPVQRRLSVSGIDALPGFDFRRSLGTNDVGTCATGDEAGYAALGRPAQCERMALLQVEWKGDFRFEPFGDDDGGDRRWQFGRGGADGTWVVFANSGRGWLVNHGTSGVRTAADLAADPLRFGRNRVPDIGTWRTDLGGGFDFGDFGVYIAQAVSQSGVSPNVYVRLGRRF